MRWIILAIALTGLHLAMQPKAYSKPRSNIVIQLDKMLTECQTESECIAIRNVLAKESLK